MPFSSWSDPLLDTIEKLTKMNFQIVLAHIDRYPRESALELLSLDLMFQLNAESLLGFFNKRRTDAYLKDGDMVCKFAALGSDIHGKNKKAAVNLLRAYRSLGQDQCQKLLNCSARLIFSN